MRRRTPILFFVILLLSIGKSYGQQGIGTNTPDKSAAAEITSKQRGLLIPRVALTSTIVEAPIITPVAESLLVYNTNTTTDAYGVRPGYYYWKRENIANPTPGKWMRLEADIKANSGLTKTNDLIQLGGNLLDNTSITQGTHNFTIATETGNLLITDLTKAGVQKHTTAGATQDHLLAVGNDNVVTALKAAMPKFFYMPSIVMPTASDQFVVGDGFTFVESTGVFTVSLYDRYKTQFGTPARSNPTTSTTLPVLPANELDYYITWYDDKVFEEVFVTDDGILTYKIKSDATVTMGTFMNVVFAVRP